jgi:hypothetical protein
VRKLVVMTATAAAFALLLGGCGHRQAGAESWANHLCTAAATWKSSVRDAAASVNGANLSQNTGTHAYDQVVSASDDFVAALRALGTPPTESGAAAKAALDDFADGIAADEQRIRDVGSPHSLADALARASVASAAVSDMVAQSSEAVHRVRTLDPAGELRDAFNHAAACRNLRSD